MTREELDELEMILHDLRMAMDIRDDIRNGTIRPIASFNDGEQIVLPVTDEVKNQVNNKIVYIEELIKNKINSIKNIRE